ncbi:MAG: hypothetical protein JSS31_06525 [Proteobacteria bacterium]|nr:hypothetical protein [Pseudomonadota bacterium]MBS0493606.1 hypothetical protein [Pseudomonadota bacterium]
MKFVLLSRHSGGSSVPENEAAQNLEDMGKWVSLLKATVAMPIRGGKTVSANHVEDYVGDVGGLLIFEADNLEQAVALAKKSPGLKYGFTHEIFPEISMDEAAKTK